MLIVKSVEPLGDFWLRLTLSDGTTIEREVGDLLRGPVFEALRTDDAEFRRARVRHGTVEWPGNLDLATDTLIWNGAAPREGSERPLMRLVLRHPTATTAR